MHKVWFDEAWNDYLYWVLVLGDSRQENVETHQCANKGNERDNFDGIGKPEPLRGEFSGFWSRRIDETNRLVYRISNGTIEILSCRGHYSPQ